MLHFCTAADVKSIFQAAGRFDASIENARQACTENFNRYLRRRLDWQEGIVETLNSQEAHGEFNIWLEKKAIDPTTLRIWYSRNREFLDEHLVEDGWYELYADKGKLVMLGRLRAGIRTIRVEYSGGFKARADAPDTMDCPANLKQAAIDQTVFELRRSTGLNQNQSADSEGKGQIKQKPLVDGLLGDVAQVLNGYRKYLAR